MRIAYGITLFTIFLMFSCSKNPEACIAVNKSSVAVGENIQFTSCSKRALSFIWSFSGPTGSSANNIERSEETFAYAFDTAGTYTVKLQAFYKYSWLGAWDTTSTVVTIN